MAGWLGHCASARADEIVVSARQVAAAPNDIEVGRFAIVNAPKGEVFGIIALGQTEG